MRLWTSPTLSINLDTFAADFECAEARILELIHEMKAMGLRSREPIAASKNLIAEVDRLLARK